MLIAFLALAALDWPYTAAGTATGTTLGVSKKAKIYDRKVLRSTGSGSTGYIASALHDVMEIKQAYPEKKIVINMSLSTTALVDPDAPYSSLDNLVTEATNLGIIVVVAAGNDSGENACRMSPARAPGAVTVGASDNSDGIASFSNVGPCVDIFAPGTGVISADATGGTQGLSGTSMATPHVAGAIINYLSAGVTDPVSLLLHDAIVKTGTAAGDVKFLYTGLMNTDHPSAAPSVSSSPTNSPAPSVSPSAAPSETPSLSPSDSPSSTPSTAP